MGVKSRLAAINLAAIDLAATGQAATDLHIGSMSRGGMLGSLDSHGYGEAQTTTATTNERS